MDNLETKIAELYDSIHKDDLTHNEKIIVKMLVAKGLLRIADGYVEKV